MFRIIVHPGLTAELASVLSKLRLSGTNVELFDATAPGERNMSGCLILVRVFEVAESRVLGIVRQQLPGGSLVAVTADISGHCTYAAIRCGADFVVNLALPDRDVAEMFRQRAQDRPHTVHSVGKTEPNRELIRLLCTPMTVLEIARRSYCSERSMYRRIRRLYDTVGVRNRFELISLSSDRGCPVESIPIND